MHALLGFKFVENSKNIKTGNMAQTYTWQNSCPVGCPFMRYCYGYCGHVANHFKNGCNISLSEMKAKIKKAMAKGELLRHNVAGDMAVPNTNTLDTKLVNELTEAFKGLNAYTYTHCEINEESAQVIKRAQESNFLINASCEKLSQVKRAKELGVNTVITVTKLTEELKAKAKAQGISLVNCLNDKGLTCKQCRVCAKNREATIVFETHGSGKKRLDKIIEQIKDY